MKLYRLALVCFFLSLWLFVGFNLSHLNSPTFDEPVHFKAGMLYQIGDFDFDPIEPPLVRRLAVNLSQFSHFSPRQIIVLITGLLAASFVYWLSGISLFAGLLGLLLFLSEPNLLAHSSLFTTDAIAAFLTVISALLILHQFWKSFKQLVILSLVIGLAASCKVASLSLIAPLLLIKLPQIKIPKFIFIVFLSSLIIWSTYDFRFQPPLKQISLAIPLGGYLRSIKENLQFAHRGQPLFFLSQLYLTGPWYKQLLVFLLKTPLVLLFLFALSQFYLLPLSVIFLVNSTVGLHFGIRHLLPATILVILSAAQIKVKSLRAQLIVTLFLLLSLLNSYRHLPQFITYTNPLAGSQPYRIFTDSDFDWGQGLVSLRSELQTRQISYFQLAYFGNIEPSDYLTGFERIDDCNPVGTLPIMPLNYDLPSVISVTCYYQAGYYRNLNFPISRAVNLAQSFLLFIHD